MTNSPSNRAIAYVLISPCRNESAYMQATIDSIANQTILPAKWVIVDDGSTDETPNILAAAAAKYLFIDVITRPDRGKRQVGGGVIEAFNCGLAAIALEDYDYLCKLDMDLEIPPNYFELILARMEANPRLGTCSGKPYSRSPQGELKIEKSGDETSVGMIKFYRRECFEQIGGFVQEVMWDGIDCHRCRMLGWMACSWDEPELRFIHLRPMGSSQKGILTGRMRHGAGQYFMGTGPIYILASSIYRASERPLIIGGLAIFAGYARSWLQGQKRYDDAEFRAFLQKFQWNCLLKGKGKATRELDEQQARKWQELTANRNS